MSNHETNLEQNHSGTGHNIARDMNVYNFGNNDFATDIAISVLVGSWDESKEDDIAALEFITNEKYSDWIIKIRQVEALDNSPLKHDSGVWFVRNRVDSWDIFSSRLFKDHLDRFKDISIKILSSIDPKFDLKPEERFGASIYGKVLSHSSSIRKGFSEGLALISTKKELLVNCASNYGEYIANVVVKEIFKTSDWMVWASTQDIQPVMAEAAPNEFLDAVENAVVHDDKPFNILFSQEGVGGVTGANYMTGLLWALESLAWSPIYLTRCVVLLGEMDSHDPGGNWANRPGNSIVDILLPWLPHTTANFERRLASLKALEREFPATAWKVLLNLLSSSHNSTFGTSKPAWRNFIPDGFNNEVTNKEYSEQIIEYSNYVVELSAKDNSRLPELVEDLDHLHDEAFDASIKLLLEYSTVKSSPENRYSLWSKLLTFINNHKNFSDTDWSLSSEKLEKLNPIVKKLQPIDKIFLYQRLFTYDIMDLFEEKGSWKEQEKSLKIKRDEAVSQLFSEGGYELIHQFAQVVVLANIVGNSLAQIVEIDEELLKECLKSDDLKIKQYISGYIWTRNYLTKGMFLENIKLGSWEPEEASRILILLPFDVKTWNKVDEVLGQDFEHFYWSNVSANSYDCDDEDNLYRSINFLLKYDRPLSAIHCLYRLLHEKKTLRLEPAVKSLFDASNTKESPTNMDSHAIGKVIKFLQTSEQLTENERFNIEWTYLPLISQRRSENSPPKYLEGRLSKDPKFFCEMISLVYKSDKCNSEVERSDSQKNIARNAYELLNKWKMTPGTQEDGTFEPNDFESWINNVVEMSKESGHYLSALRVIGKNLINSPEENDGQLWIHTTIAEFLNRRELKSVRDAFKMAVYNSRGAHFIDPEAKPELKLSEVYKSKSEALELLGYQRIARTLREISEGYTIEAEAIIKRESQLNQLPAGDI